MQPEVGLRIATMIKALDDVIVPELQSGSAVEQAALIRGTLALLAAQADHSHDYSRADLQTHVALCRGLAVATQDQQGEELGARAARALDDPATSDVELERWNRHLRSWACEAIKGAYACTDAAIRRSVEQITLDYARRQTDRERAWVQLTGFDPFPNEIASIAAAARLAPA